MLLPTLELKRLPGCMREPQFPSILQWRARTSTLRDSVGKDDGLHAHVPLA